MNYRHSFHAGNFADVMKHAVLARILVHLAAKPKPFRVIDTHAGTGLYDLTSLDATATAEWREGIGRLDAAFEPAAETLLAPYRAAVGETRRRYGERMYPGSPAILREMLRGQDRGILIEKHPEDGALLRSRFNAVSNLKVLTVDGWAALAGLVPPPERRGLVFIDPPYEERDELMRAVERLAAIGRRWPTGVYALWYPIKARSSIDRFYDALGPALAAPALRLDLEIDDAPDGPGLRGCGLAVVNPPWRLAEEAAILLPALARRLARRGEGAWRVEPLSIIEDPITASAAIGAIR